MRGGRKAMVTPGVLALERRQDITLIKAPKLEVPQSKLQKPQHFSLDAPSFMKKPDQAEKPGAFAIPAFRIAPENGEKK